MQSAFKACLIAVSLAGVPKPAAAYDMDCAIMLCMAGGFPPSAVCAAAFAEMIRRITPWPSLPPFGICTYAGLPVALGGSGTDEALDVSTPDYAWLNRTRVLWWQGRHWKSNDDGDQWSWSLGSCDGENSHCRVIARNPASGAPWPSTFLTENGQIIEPPVSRSIFATRAVMIEYGDYAGALDHSDWFRY